MNWEPVSIYPPIIRPDFRPLTEWRPPVADTNLTMNVAVNLDKEALRAITRQVHEEVERALFDGLRIPYIPEQTPYLREARAYLDHLRGKLYRIQVHQTAELARTPPGDVLRTCQAFEQQTVYLRRAILQAEDDLRSAENSRQLEKAARHALAYGGGVNTIRRALGLPPRADAPPADDTFPRDIFTRYEGGYRVPLYYGWDPGTSWEYVMHYPKTDQLIGYQMSYLEKEKRPVKKEKEKKFYVLQDGTAYVNGRFATEAEATDYATAQARESGKSFVVLRATRRVRRPEPPIKNEPIR